MFHDIGKFYQRTRNKDEKKRITREYQWYVKQLGREYISHEEWSASFIRHYFKSDSIETLVLRHHHPETILDFIISIADKLSASERDRGQDEKEGRVNVAREPLISVLSSIKGIRQVDEVIETSFKPLVFEPTQRINPVKEKEQAIQDKDYQDCWDNFVKRMETTLTGESISSKRFYQLFQTLADYTQTIPSAAYYSRPTVSLFDHSRTTAAIAAALYRENPTIQELQEMNQMLLPAGKHRTTQKAYWLLVAGDISGIQDFVYDLTSKGAVKGLRGRSFYIQIIVEAITNYILSREKLAPCNIIYAGGGHFYLLLPASAVQRIDSYQQYIDKVLYKAHHGQLSIILGAVPLTIRNFGQETFSTHWREAGNIINQNKRRKYINLLREQPEKILGPYYEGDSVCSICSAPVHDEQDKCNFCLSFESMGDMLAQGNNYILEYLTDPVPPGEKLTSMEDVLVAFGYTIKFSNTPDARAIVSAINGDEKPETGDKTIWLANNTPHGYCGNIATFEDLAQRATGEKVWGVLRGDVDNLGKVFAEGLGEDRSISKISALSREIAFFFSGRLNQICSRYQEQVYVIYAGGDDFFLVGSWSILPVLAAEIHNEFKAYCANNPHITLSCAISNAPGIAYPLFKVAKTAGDELDEKAKGTRWINGHLHSKDSISFLGRAFTWSEMEEVKQVKNDIAKAINQEGTSKALIHSIYSACTCQKAFMEQKHTLSRIWRFVYSLTRLKVRTPKARDTLSDLERKLIIGKSSLYQNAYEAARWAEKELKARGDTQ